jgi:hypothetical protein
MRHSLASLLPNNACRSSFLRLNTAPMLTAATDEASSSSWTP